MWLSMQKAIPIKALSKEIVVKNKTQQNILEETEDNSQNEIKLVGINPLKRQF